MTKSKVDLVETQHNKLNNVKLSDVPLKNILVSSSNNSLNCILSLYQLSKFKNTPSVSYIVKALHKRYNQVSRTKALPNL